MSAYSNSRAHVALRTVVKHRQAWKMQGPAFRGVDFAIPRQHYCSGGRQRHTKQQRGTDCWCRDRLTKLNVRM